jgi:NodT family efflux transporter outer membrane factor (OMF) lipoprotein
MRAAAGILLMLAACTVGPDFERPRPPTSDRYTADPLPAVTVSAPVAQGEAQHFLPGRDLPGEWWRLFRSPPLDALVKDAIKANPNLATAEAALRQAHELRLAGEGAFFPLVQGSLNASRNKTAATVSPATATGALYYNQYTALLAVSYVPDVFGGTRRMVEGLLAQEEAQRFQVEAAYLTLTSGLVAAALGEAGLRAQIDATTEIIRIQRDSLEILRRQFALGQVSGQEVAAQEAALAQAEASLPPLRKQSAQQRDLIAALAGRVPGDRSNARFEIVSLQLPADLPLSLPSSLVEHRPDIRAAEATLHAASAAIGVALAARLPQIMLNANGGRTVLSPLTVASLFGPGTSFWTIAGSATQTIFDAGTLLHKERAARAAFDQAAAQYKQTVLTAFQNVADSLEALKSDADTLSAAVAAEKAATDALEIARRQLSAGAVNYLALLTAEGTYQTVLIARVQAEAIRLADTAALFQALGGGWWHRVDVVEARK